MPVLAQENIIKSARQGMQRVFGLRLFLQAI
jgi:hypothetical protein